MLTRANFLPSRCGDHRGPLAGLLGGLAEFERDLIRARTSEGRERATARAVSWAANRNPPNARRARQSAGAPAIASRYARSPAATTSATARFRGSQQLNPLSAALAPMGKSISLLEGRRVIIYRTQRGIDRR